MKRDRINTTRDYQRILDMIPRLFTIFYASLMGLAIFIGSRFDETVVVNAVMLACCLGVMFKRPWALPAIFWAGILCLATGVFEFFYGGFNTDPLLLGFLVVSLAVVFYFRSPLALKYYQDSSSAVRIKKILLIDDDKSLLKLLQTNFQKEGYLVFSAESGEKGLDLARQTCPDIILLDVILPGMKGRNVCARLKEDGQTKDIPVIFLTAKDSPDDVRAELAAGAAAHITKPVDYRSLSAEVKKFLK